MYEIHKREIKWTYDWNYKSNSSVVVYENANWKLSAEEKHDIFTKKSVKI